MCSSVLELLLPVRQVENMARHVGEYAGIKWTHLSMRNTSADGEYI